MHSFDDRNSTSLQSPENFHQKSLLCRQPNKRICWWTPQASPHLPLLWNWLKTSRYLQDVLHYPMACLYLLPTELKEVRLGFYGQNKQLQPLNETNAVLPFIAMHAPDILYPPNLPQVVHSSKHLLTIVLQVFLNCFDPLCWPLPMTVDCGFYRPLLRIVTTLQYVWLDYCRQLSVTTFHSASGHLIKLTKWI